MKITNQINNLGFNIGLLSYNNASANLKGFNGMEKDDEVKGSGNHYDFGARMYDSRIGRWLSIDPLAAKYPAISPYAFVANTPIMAIDPDGNLIIFINGEAPVEEQGKQSYWVHYNKIVNAPASIGYKLNDHNIIFRNADQTKGVLGSDWPLMRERNGRGRAGADFESIKASLKENMKDGKITETVKIISHSKGAAMANGYAQKLNQLLQEWRESEPELFEGDGGKIELVIHVAPHQSDAIYVPPADFPTIAITHEGDILSDDDATGDLINIKTKNPQPKLNSHTIRGFWDEIGDVIDQHLKNKESDANKYKNFNGLLDGQIEFKEPSEKK